MPDKFFKKNFHKSLVAVIGISSLGLACDILPAGLKLSQLNSLVYAGDNYVNRPGFLYAEAEAVIGLLEKERSSLQEQLLRTQYDLNKT